MPASYSSNSAWSKVFMPSRLERAITSLILATSPLNIKSEISGECKHDLHCGDAPGSRSRAGSGAAKSGRGY